MAKITIAGDAIVVTSSLKLEDIKTVGKYRPAALKLMGGKDKDEPIFAIGTTTGVGNINGIGVSFGGETHDDDKLATVTLYLDGDGTQQDIKDMISDKLGGAITLLNKLEAEIPAVLEEIAEEKATVLSSITVV
jgi:hypothetical protein